MCRPTPVPFVQGLPLVNDQLTSDAFQVAVVVGGGVNVAAFA